MRETWARAFWLARLRRPMDDDDDEAWKMQQDFWGKHVSGVYL